ncbi:hypothetical protein DK37_28260 [Halomonas sp. SUBG004]|nr:hypothetical protein DK37_28260 [Halomonas sp. SUBG004]
MGISINEPPATPDTPQAARADTMQSSSAVGEIHANSQGVRSRQRNHGNGDRRAAHIDGGT